MATHHPASIDAPVVPDSPALTLSAVERDGHHSDLDLASLEHAFAGLEDERRECLELPQAANIPPDPEWLATLDVALAAIYAEICRRAPRAETVAPDSSARERILAGLGVVGPVTMPPSDYGPDLTTRARLARYVAPRSAAHPDLDAPAGAGDVVEAFRG